MFEFTKHLFRVQFLLIVLAVLAGVYYNEISQHIRRVIEEVQLQAVNTQASETAASKTAEQADETLFTREQLAHFNGENAEGLLYLALLGKVYDVTKGAKHYGSGCSYHYFVGRDASVSFISGEFEHYDAEKADDVVEQLEPQDLLGLENWSRFYGNDYIYKGKLIGRFYDEQGDPTSYYFKYQFLLDKAREGKAREAELRSNYPDCNIEWAQKTGTRVWCTKTSGGGAARDWIGHPRKLMVGKDNFRCACVKQEELDATNSMLEPYDNCDKLSHECYYNVA